MGIATSQSIRRDADVEMVFVIPSLAELLPALRVSMIAQYFEAGKKLLELHLPVEQDAGRYDNEVRPPYATVAREMRE